jgi:phosphotransferase system enzyme I (PtsI)
MKKEEEVHILGIPVSDGIAIGAPFFLESEEENIPQFPITLSEVDHEICRYRKALFSSREDLKKLQDDLSHQGSSEVVTILDTHIQMLEDPLMTTEMEDQIREKLQNTEAVFHTAISNYEKRFSKTSDLFFQERLVDVMDLAKRVLGHLSPHKGTSLCDIPYNSIVFVKELTPSHTASAHCSKVSAFVTQIGGGNSHAALIARAKGIPYVGNIDIQSISRVRWHSAIVDGQTGEVILNPSKETLEKFKQRKTSLKTSMQLLQKELHYDAETIDGYMVQVHANIGSLSEVEQVRQVNAEGIGLFRSEYLFFEKGEILSSEEEQYQIYCELIHRAAGLPVVIRVFDIGGDKHPDFFAFEHKEPNPVLGCRGIRFLLRYPDIFKTQLRAIARASLYGDVRILLPLISDIQELLDARALLQEMTHMLIGEGVEIIKKIPLGCMIEVPSSVLICDAIAKECDFLSIGTNDLVQYTLGIDRSNPVMSDSCYPAHPSVIRMIKMVVTEARRCNKRVSICGEIASSPLFIPLLLGLGVDEISCSPRYIPSVKRAIRQIHILKAAELAQHVLTLNSSAEIAHALLNFIG